MIKYVEVTNSMNETLTIPLSYEGAASTGLLITDITGIGHVKANMNFTDIAESDIKKYNSASLDKRNIVISFMLVDENMSIEEARHICYKFFPAKRLIHLTFKTDTREQGIDGYVESNEADIFKEMETQQVSIICADPFFYNEDGGLAERTVTTFYGMTPMFTFPFCNESPVEKELIFGEYERDKENLIEYPGEYDTGCTIEMHFGENVYNPVIINSENGRTLRVDTTKLPNIIAGSDHFINGDDVIVNGTKGKKSAQLIRDGIVYQILPLVVGSDWPELNPGNNYFVFHSDNDAIEITVTFKFKISYLGV